MADNTGQTKQRKPRKVIEGIVTSAHKAASTITVQVQYRVRHPKYGKYVHQSTKLHAHDPASVANEGDRVQVMECRPVSKTKTWRLMKVVEAAPQD